MSACVDLCSALSLRTANAMDALVSREQVRSEQTPKQSVLFVGSRIKSGREFQAVGPICDACDAAYNANKTIGVVGPDLRLIEAF